MNVEGRRAARSRGRARAPLLAALVTRPARRDPLRLIATIAGVALGVASVVATLLSTRAAEEGLERDALAPAGAARLEVSRAGGLDPAQVRDLAPIDALAQLLPRIDETALVPALDDLVRVVGVDLLARSTTEGLSLDAGGRPLEEARRGLLRERGIALPAPLGRTLGVRPGGELELLVRTRRAVVPVVAWYEVSAPPVAWERTIVCDLATADELYGRGGRVDHVVVVPRGGIPLARLERELRRRVAPGTTVRHPEDRRLETERMVRALEFNLTALAGISILVGAVLVGTTLATSVVQRRYELALARTLGASRGQLARAVLLEAGAIGLLGGALGVLLGRVGAELAAGEARATLAAVVEEALGGPVRLGWLVAVFGVGLGVTTALAAALVPLVEATRTPPLAGLREERPASPTPRARRARGAAFAVLCGAAAALLALPARGDRPIGPLLASLCLLGTLLVAAAPTVSLLARLSPGISRSGPLAPLVLAQAALGAGRRRAGWAAGAIGVAVALAIAMAAMVGSFERAVVEWSRQAMRADLFVRPPAAASGVPVGRLDPQIVEVARQRFGDPALDPFHSTVARVDGALVQLAGGVFEVRAREGGVPFLSGRDSREVFREALERGGCVVSEPFSRRFGWGVGDRALLETAAGPLAFPIVGVFRDYSDPGGRVVIDRAAFLARFPDEGPRSLSVFLPEGRDAARAREELLAALGDRFVCEVLLGEELHAEVLAAFRRTFAITNGLRWVASAVAVLAVLTVLFALVRERRRELAVLRAVGASAGQVRAVVTIEAGLLGLAGAAGGLLVGLVVGWVLVRFVNVQSFGWSMPFRPAWPSIAATALAVVPACLLAGLPPARSAARLSLREVLHDDG